MNKTNSLTDIASLIGKTLSMEVAQSVDLRVKVLNEKEIEYQFIGTNDETKDPVFKRDLEIAYDDIDHRYDYSFTDILGLGRFFLFQFDEVN